jgi:hypothetical protein
MTFSSGQTLTAASLNEATARGLIDEVIRTSSSGTFTTTETVLDYITFTAISGATYELRMATVLQSSVANDLIGVRFRWLAAAALTTSGTEFHRVTFNADIVNRGQIMVTQRTITGLTAGQVSIGVTAVRHSGTGNIISDSSSIQTSGTWLYRI